MPLIRARIRRCGRGKRSAVGAYSSAAFATRESMRLLCPLWVCLSISVSVSVVHAEADAPPKPKPENNVNDATPTQAQEGARGLDKALQILHAPLSGGTALSPAESLKTMKAAAGLAVDLIAAEPTVRQPLSISFDERGRMWVVQYIQYPFPAGLKIVEYDQYLRAKFDKVPPPPPKHFPGADKITIFEDVNGDGSFAKSKDFLTGLSIATSELPGRGGVWIMNPPYLLFYPVKNRGDIPDGDPEVHLSGFGLEDTHAVASNLTWGPDGWIYGAQGSTCTAKVKVEIAGETKTTDFLGQAIWRYHPETHRFEIFAEGGGNTFGMEFDDQGRVYSGTNSGAFRGLHFVQGGYYVKGWGKHGPLTNPYAFGFFNHMPHTGNGDRFTHTFVVYGGGALPAEYTGKIIGPNPLQKRIQVARLEPLGSTFKTVEEPFLLSSSDGWFRPVDLKTGPDGALYIADFYENRISHVDPRDNWDRGTGRIYRIRGEQYTPVPPKDLSQLSSAQLVELLSHKNRWYRQTARRLLGDRKDPSVIPQLRETIEKNSGQLALEALWALNLCNGFDDPFALKAFGHPDPFVREWSVRLVGDAKSVSPALAAQLALLAAREPVAEVRGQLASSAKRLPAAAALPILVELFKRGGDVNDPFIPMLCWWALEAKAESDRDAVLRLFGDSSALWQQPMVEDAILERLIRRYAAAGGTENLEACATLLADSQKFGQTATLLAGLEKVFAGRTAGNLPEKLKAAIERAWPEGGASSNILLGLRIGRPEALEQALQLIADEKAGKENRQSLIRTLGEISQPRCVPVLLRLLPELKNAGIQCDIFSALQRYDDPQIGAAVLALYPEKLPEAGGVRDAALDLLASRPSTSLQFLQAIDDGKINPRTIPLGLVRKLALHQDEAVAKKIEKHWGRVQASTAAEKQAEMDRILSLVTRGAGSVPAGKTLFTASCAKCHTLFGEGGKVGPELTGYERDKPAFWVENIVDPSAVIREEYTTFIVKTKDGRVLTGIVSEQEARTVTLSTPEGQRIRLDRDQIEKMKASPISLMPEDLLRTLEPQQIRDLFAYLMSAAPPRK